MPGTPLSALASQATGRRRCFDARDHVRHVERCLDDLGEQVLGIAVEHPSSGRHARHTENWPQDPEETAAELKPHLDVVAVYGDHSEDIGRDLSSPYAGPGQLRPLQELSPEGEHLMPRLATVLGGPLCSDFVIPEGLEPPLTLARIFGWRRRTSRSGSAVRRAASVRDPIRSAALCACWECGSATFDDWLANDHHSRP